ncbi:aspartate racemase [Acidihalobacter yilgarnensis]|uniref:Aspartate racemase n=2 Tax=Acidihalobacter yilgarnensis TaxID=2819280 RepID=A0A1D8ITD6_9GAMM|nr:aspartate racemase [Acidihalobacter yilgarnensis]
MKTIGLIGGMSWESTVPYYQYINTRVKQRLGGLHSARLLLYSVDFHDIELLQHADRWDDAGRLLADAARTLETAGADCVVLCTNTMHKVAPAIAAAVAVPLLHIADATAAAVLQRGIRRVGLLGTRFTMEQDFYRCRLQAHGIEVLIPEARDREIIHSVIYEELCLGIVEPASRAQYREIIERLVGRGAEGIILGCTEIAMLISADDASVALFDTAELHATAAVDFALDIR